MCAFLHQNPWRDHDSPQYGIALLPVGGSLVVQFGDFSCRHPCLYRVRVIAGDVGRDIHQIKVAADLNERALGKKTLQFSPFCLGGFGIELGAHLFELVEHVIHQSNLEADALQSSGTLVCTWIAMLKRFSIRAPAQNLYCVCKLYRY